MRAEINTVCSAFYHLSNEHGKETKTRDDQN